ncbi:MAG: FAD-dependent oxidoreductase, partial [Gemmataceae bacterium]|nr:FAD-dependent oxidoreductase [Gemmataceae bacterium]
MKIIIVGGVAGGASAATRLRRLSEDAQIIMFERGPDVSFANCGMPYHIGNEIPDRNKLLVVTPERLKERFNLDVRVHTEITQIDPQAKKVIARNVLTGETSTETYDKLILATGAAPFRPQIEGIDHPRIHTLRNLVDMDRIKKTIDSGTKNAVVIGAGFIGLELIENFLHRGLNVTLVEFQNQILPIFDPEMTTPVLESLQKKGVSVLLGDAAEKFTPTEKGVAVQLKSGKIIETELVVLGVGVRPENHLAIQAGLEVGPRGGVRVNRHMQTSHPDIYAVGDVVEVFDLVLSQNKQVPLA